MWPAPRPARHRHPFAILHSTNWARISRRTAREDGAWDRGKLRATRRPTRRPTRRATTSTAVVDQALQRTAWCGRTQR